MEAWLNQASIFLTRKDKIFTEIPWQIGQLTLLLTSPESSKEFSTLGNWYFVNPSLSNLL